MSNHYDSHSSKMLRPQLSTSHTYPLKASIFTLLTFLPHICLLGGLGFMLAGLLTPDWGYGEGNGRTYYRGLYNQCNAQAGQSRSCSISNSCSLVGAGGISPTSTLCFELDIARGLAIAAIVCGGVALLFSLLTGALSKSDAKKFDESSSSTTGSHSYTYSDGSQYHPAALLINFTKLTISSIITAALALGAAGGSLAALVVGAYVLCNQLTLESFIGNGAQSIAFTPSWSLIYMMLGAGFSATAAVCNLFLWALPHARQRSYLPPKQINDGVEMQPQQATYGQQGQYSNTNSRNHSRDEYPSVGQSQQQQPARSSWFGWGGGSNSNNNPQQMDDRYGSYNNNYQRRSQQY